jgi:hypothetical protein
MAANATRELYNVTMAVPRNEVSRRSALRSATAPLARGGRASRPAQSEWA